jgi:hypothetical protein
MTQAEKVFEADASQHTDFTTTKGRYNIPALKPAELLPAWLGNGGVQ